VKREQKKRGWRIIWRGKALDKKTLGPCWVNIVKVRSGKEKREVNEKCDDGEILQSDASRKDGISALGSTALTEQKKSHQYRETQPRYLRGNRRKNYTTGATRTTNTIKTKVGRF